VGHFLRLVAPKRDIALSFSGASEIAQIYNIFRGEMSLVGPRPERPEFLRELTKKIPYYEVRHAVRPGITGWPC